MIVGIPGSIIPGTETVYGSFSIDSNQILSLNSKSVPQFRSEYWEDLRFPAQGINPAGSAAPPTVDTSTFPGTLLFSGTGGNNIIAGVAQLPHEWKEGSEVRPHIHATRTTTSTDAVGWEFKYVVANANEVLGAYTAWQTATESVISNVAEKHGLWTFPAITMTGKLISCMIIWQLQRNTADAYNSNARLLELDFHYQIDTTGSSSEFSK